LCIIVTMLTYVERTRIIDKPESVHLNYDETLAEFHCSATSDDSTPVMIRWYRSGKSIPVISQRGRVNVTVSADGTFLSFLVRANDTDGWAMVTGVYQCNATNGYSSEAAEFSLQVDPLPVPLRPSTTPKCKPSATDSLS